MLGVKPQKFAEPRSKLLTHVYNETATAPGLQTSVLMERFNISEEYRDVLDSFLQLCKEEFEIHFNRYYAVREEQTSGWRFRRRSTTEHTIEELKGMIDDPNLPAYFLELAVRVFKGVLDISGKLNGGTGELDERVIKQMRNAFILQMAQMFQNKRVARLI